MLLLKKFSGSKKNISKSEVVALVKLSALSLRQETHEKVDEIVKGKLRARSVPLFNEIATIFVLPSLREATRSYMERWFACVTDNRDYLHLGYASVSRLLKSDSLLVDSEAEVCRAADKWLSFDVEERGKLAGNLLLAVRLPLLSRQTAKGLLESSSSFREFEVSNAASNDGALKRTRARFCDQNKFGILMFTGGTKAKKKSPVEVDASDLATFRVHRAPPYRNRLWSAAVFLKGQVYLLSGRHSERRNVVYAVDKYSPSVDGGRWEKVADMPDNRLLFCACAYRDKIFVMGGIVVGGGREYGAEGKRCYQLDTEDCTWREGESMNEIRVGAACAVYKGALVVSGGMWLKSVEQHEDGSWTAWGARMNEGRNGHSLLAVGSKLFAVGCTFTNFTCEVFDDDLKKFVFVKQHAKINKINVQTCLQAVSVGSKLYVFCMNVVFSFDIDRGKWSEEHCGAFNSWEDFHCVKLPLSIGQGEKKPHMSKSFFTKALTLFSK